MMPAEPALRIAALSDRAAWDAIAATTGVPSHQWSYAAALAQGGLAPCIAEARAEGGRVVIPFFERGWHGSTDVCTLLSVSGATAEGLAGPALALWQAQARARGWVAGYLQFAPGSGLAGVEGLRDGNEVLRLDPVVQGRAHEASGNIRAKLHEAQRMGAELVTDPPRLAEALVTLYPAAMARLGAAATHALGDATLRALAAAPGTLLLGAAVQGRIEAVALFPATATQAEYFLSAATEAGRVLSALLIREAIARLADRGVRMLNLGGGVRPGDGIHSFKRRFGGEPARLQALCQVYDPAAFAALCARFPAPAGSRWFPPYRVGAAG